jgi:hypothetical protein
MTVQLASQQTHDFPVTTVKTQPDEGLKLRCLANSCGIDTDPGTLSDVNMPWNPTPWVGKHRIHVDDQTNSRIHAGYPTIAGASHMRHLLGR